MADTYPGILPWPSYDEHVKRGDEPNTTRLSQECHNRLQDRHH